MKNRQNRRGKQEVILQIDGGNYVVEINRNFVGLSNITLYFKYLPGRFPAQGGHGKDDVILVVVKFELLYKVFKRMPCDL